MRAWRTIGLVGLGLVLAACRDEVSPTDVFAAGSDELQDAHCACDRGSSSCRERALSECAERAVRKHEDSIASWLKCAGRAMHQEAECVEESECSDALEACRREPEDVCGPAPELPTQRIQEEIETSCEDSDARDDSGGDTSSPSSDDGEPACSGGSEEVPVAGCLVPPRSPSDAGVAGVAGSVSSADSGVATMCLQANQELGNPDSACVHCACAAAPMVASVCNTSCWQQIECVNRNCAAFETNSAEQAACAVEKCQTFLAGSLPSTQLGPILRDVCASSCLVPIKPPPP